MIQCIPSDVFMLLEMKKILDFFNIEKRPVGTDNCGVKSEAKTPDVLKSKENVRRSTRSNSVESPTLSLPPRKSGEKRKRSDSNESAEIICDTLRLELSAMKEVILWDLEK